MAPTRSAWNPFLASLASGLLTRLPIAVSIVASPRSAAVFGLTLGIFASVTLMTVQATEPTRPESPSKSKVVPSDYGEPAGLPRPSNMTVNAFEAILFEFVNEGKYKQLGWMVDKGVRDTGPFLDGKYYGTHPAARIYYSPEVIEWLVSGRKAKIPDGAVIIKEQYRPPAARHENSSERELWEALESWTIMVKDSKGSHDGWFWSNPGKNQQVVNYYEYPFEEPYSGFGLYCVRCHGSTKSPGVTNEYTFSSLRNIAGFPGEPLLFRVDDSWREPVSSDHSNESKLEGLLALQEAANSVADSTTPDDLRSESRPEDSSESGGPIEKLISRDSHPRCTESDFPTPCQPELNTAFLEAFPQLASCLRSDTLHIPPVTYDSVPRAASTGNETRERQQAFVTSNQCMSCHAGLTEPFGPTMFIPTGDSAGYAEPGLHISPYGEWRWTPMGLAGRDPIFYAQLESELALLEKRYGDAKADKIGRNLQKTCLGCHGVMGKRQHDLDVAAHSSDTFQIEDMYHQELDPSQPGHAENKYGALGRDGVSCAVCHRMQPRPQPEGDSRAYLEHFLETSITGHFYLGEPGEIYGPYKDEEVSPYVMDHSLAFKPKHSEYIKSSQMCGTCHTVNLPIVDWEREPDEELNDLMLAEPNPELQDFHHHVEQATYLEWLNSSYENEIDTANQNGKSCQDCHMSKGIQDPASGVDIDHIETRIAAIQDQSYPDAENLATHEEIRVRQRREYSRHNFRGLNVFMLEMFNQFDDVLGVRKHDYMTGSKTDIQHAVNDFMRQARNDTARISVGATMGTGTELVADVTIESLAGHRFPSGVGFRRAFLEVLVEDVSRPEGEQVIWSSGRTNEVGILIDEHGNPLPTEFFELDAEGNEQYQPHHEEISSSDQVQIYETLLHTRDGDFTTSFIHGCTVIKDNRFLPKGWTPQGPGGGLKGHFLTATYPGPLASQDSSYQDGSGSDTTRYRVSLPSGVDSENVRVQATLYYQAIPPYFLRNIFDLSPDGEATKRLHYICSNLKLKGTPIEDWKLPVVTASTMCQ
jgi:cytochrome c551/c552